MPDYRRSEYFLTNVNTEIPFKIMMYSLLFIYVLQFPLSLLLNVNPETNIDVTFFSISEAYGFVLLSTLILFLFFDLGTRDISNKYLPYFFKQTKSSRIISFNKTLLIFFLFFLWSFIMLKLKIGITIYADFEPLPFRLVGLLFYGRLFIQPIILAYIAHSYRNSSKKNIVFILLFMLGLWVALTSGSRFAAVMFAVPILLLYKGKAKYLNFVITVFIFIIIGTLSRHFFLPYQVGGKFIEIYANEIYQSYITKDLIFLPFSYLVFRIMGISELVLTLNFQSLNFLDGVYSMIAYFNPFMENSNLISAKDVYGLTDEFGGIGLDIFSNYWLLFGRNLISYILGLSIISIMFGRIYAFSSIILEKLNFKEGELVVLILLFILLIEGRSHIFPILLLLSWFLYKIKIRKV